MTPAAATPTWALLLLGLILGGQGSLAAAGNADKTCAANDPSCQAEPLCSDTRRECVVWANSGECVRNVNWMKKNCALSCGACELPLPEDETEETCRDFHPSCDEWAEQGECVINAPYMKSSCRESCSICVHVKKLREEGVPEGDIRKRYRYSTTNWGVEQDYAGVSESEQQILKPRLLAMERYAKRNGTELSLTERKLCANHDKQCAFWAASGECETNTEFMMSKCALACFMCHHIERFQKCGKGAVLEKARELQLLKPGDVYNKVYQSLMKREEVELASSLPVNSQDDPWVVKIDNFLDEKETHFLLELIKKDSKWNASIVPVDENAFVDNDGAVRRTSSSLLFKETRIIQEDKVDLATRKIASLLDAPLFHMETPIEFVRYESMQSYGVHHEFQLIDRWMPAGPRVWTTFLTLNDVEEGGATGFPELDWLSIQPKRGQLLIWPNVLSSDPSQSKAPKMWSEGLPVLKGEKYGLFVHFRMFDYDEAMRKRCT